MSNDIELQSECNRVKLPFFGVDLRLFLPLPPVAGSIFSPVPSFPSSVSSGTAGVLFVGAGVAAGVAAGVGADLDVLVLEIEFHLLNCNKQ